MIANVRVWYKRKHGEMGYHLAQVLTGHGCFKKYFYRIDKSVDERCGGTDDADYTMFACSRWEEKRANLTASLGQEMSRNNIIELMVSRQEAWKSVEKFIIAVMTTKDQDERRKI